MLRILRTSTAILAVSAAGVFAQDTSEEAVTPLNPEESSALEAIMSQGAEAQMPAVEEPGVVDTVTPIVPEDALSDAEAAQIVEQQTQAQPEVVDTLRQEIDSGLTGSDLRCADGAEPPCADAPLVTPENVPIGLSESGDVYPLPVEGETMPGVAPTELTAEEEMPGVIPPELMVEAEDQPSTEMMEAPVVESAPAPIEVVEPPEVEVVEPITPLEPIMPDAGEAVAAEPLPPVDAVDDGSVIVEAPEPLPVEPVVTVPTGEASSEDLRRALEAAAEGEPVAATDPAITPSPAPITPPEDPILATDEDAAELAPGGVEALAGGGQPEVVDTTLTSDMVRTSAEDFDNRVNEKSSSLSDDERALLFGLGGFAVGTLLADDRTVELNTGDRVVVQMPDGTQRVLKDDDAILFQAGADVRTERYTDGSSRTIVVQEDGTQIITIRDAEMRILRRSVMSADGTEVILIDETAPAQPVVVEQLPDPVVVTTPVQINNEPMIRQVFLETAPINRTFTLQQIRTIPEVRYLVAPIEVDEITFDTASAAIKPDQAKALAALGSVMVSMIRDNPREVFLIEGHTDSVGKDAMNLALSDRRAESVAKALTEYFGVPPQNMVVQGYGEQFLKIPREGDIRENRRAAVRRITPLLLGQ